MKKNKVIYYYMKKKTDQMMTKKKKMLLLSMKWKISIMITCMEKMKLILDKENYLKRCV